MEKSALCVSYIPLFAVNEDELRKNWAKDVNGFIKHIYDAIGRAPSPVACVWGIDEGKHVPCFLIDQARAVVDHLLCWSEHDPSQWFKLVIDVSDNHYDVALFPNLIKSKERHSLQNIILREETLPESMSYQFLFRPLHFRSNGRGMINEIKMGNESMVGFIEAAEFNLSNLDPTKLPEPTMVGPFKVSDDDEFKGYFKEIEEVGHG